MRTANTLEVRKIVKSLNINYGYIWTDKSVDNNMRLVAFQVADNLDSLFDTVVAKFNELGFDNQIKVTATHHSKYLRIRASFGA